jgi:hypothetical protein
VAATRQALDVTEAYRARLSKLTQGVQDLARKAWGDVSFDDLRATYGPVRTRVEKAIRAAQKEAVLLTRGYVAAFISAELGEKADAPHVLTVQYVGRSFGDQPLYSALQTPLTVVLVAIKDGKADPMGLGLQALLVNVDLNVKHAAREALMYLIDEDPRITGWSRAIRGTCGACAEAAVGDNTEASFEVHPNCECVAEPTVEPKMASDVVDEAHTMQEVANEFTIPPSDVPGYVFTPTDEAAVQGYEGTPNSFEINSALREDFSLPGEPPVDILAPGSDVSVPIQAEVMALDTALDHAGPIGQETSAFRMLDQAPEGLGMKAGETFTEKGYSSTTSAPKGSGYFATKLTQLELSVSPSVKAIWGGNPLEGELLVQRNARYVIRSVGKDPVLERGGVTKWIVKAEVLPPKDDKK